MTVESAGVVFNAAVRVGIHGGFEVSTPSIGPSILGLDASAGIEVGVYAKIAEFTTNVTAITDDDDDVEDDCALRVEEYYQLALGANAGASVAFRDHAWGPVPSTEIPIFYTALANGCAAQKESPVAPRAAVPTGLLEARQGEDLTMTTLSREETYTGVSCLSGGLVNCPASLQATTTFSTERTHVTAVPSGSVATTVASLEPFGENVVELLSSSGRPVSFVPSRRLRNSLIERPAAYRTRSSLA